MSLWMLWLDRHFWCTWRAKVGIQSSKISSVWLKSLARTLELQILPVAPFCTTGDKSNVTLVRQKRCCLTKKCSQPQTTLAELIWCALLKRRSFISPTSTSFISTSSERCFLKSTSLATPASTMRTSTNKKSTRRVKTQCCSSFSLL